MLEKECDIVLSQLINLQGETSVSRSLILMTAKGISVEIYEDCLAIMMHRGHIQVLNGPNGTPTNTNHLRFVISEHGKYFYKILGGYEKEMIGINNEKAVQEAEKTRLKNLEDRQAKMAALQTEYIRRSLIINICIAVATSFAAIYYLNEILKTPFNVSENLRFQIISYTLIGIAILLCLLIILNIRRKREKEYKPK